MNLGCTLGFILEQTLGQFLTSPSISKSNVTSGNETTYICRNKQNIKARTHTNKKWYFCVHATVLPDLFFCQECGSFVQTRRNKVQPCHKFIVGLAAAAAALRHSSFAQYQSRRTKAAVPVLMARWPAYLTLQCLQLGNSHVKQRLRTLLFSVGPYSVIGFKRLQCSHARGARDWHFGFLQYRNMFWVL